MWDQVSSSYSTAVLAAVVQKSAFVDAAIITNVGSGRGRAVAARSSGASPTISAVNNGTGPAATFTGGLSAPQIHLNPGHLTTHPVSGTVGDFYLDAGARLWFCKGARRGSRSRDSRHDRYPAPTGVNAGRATAAPTRR